MRAERRRRARSRCPTASASRQRTTGRRQAAARHRRLAGRSSSASVPHAECRQSDSRAARTTRRAHAGLSRVEEQSDAATAYLAQHQGRVAAAAVHRAEPRVDAQPRRQRPAPGRSRRRPPSGSSGSCGVDLRQETHCGQSEYATHRDAHADVARADREHLLVQQRHRRPVRTAVLLGQRAPRCARSSTTRAGTSSRWTKPDSGGNAPRHAESIGKPGST